MKRQPSSDPRHRKGKSYDRVYLSPTDKYLLRRLADRYKLTLEQTMSALVKLNARALGIEPPPEFDRETDDG